MAGLESGKLYHIRFVPSGLQPPLVGGLYATATDIGEPILAEAQGDKDLPTWQVNQTPNGKWTITQPGFQSKFGGIGPVLMGWSLSNPSLRFPGGSILFKVDYAELDLEAAVVEKHLVYSLKVPNPEGIHSITRDCEFYVSERDHTVTSQAYWSGLRYHRPHPHWEFIPARSN